MLETWYSFKADRALPGQIDSQVATGRLVVLEDEIETPIVVGEAKIDDWRVLA